ncbi:MAG: transposase [Anaerolineaceae bacterium]|nr:transposase [Anaerolineaceae bacterium]
MWLYRTEKKAKQKLVLYDYQETHEAKHPKAFLNGFKEYLHEELSHPVLNELRSWISRLNAPPKSLLGKAENYVISQWSWLTVWMEDGRLEISNKLVERSIKPFVIGRKNWIFVNAPGGARSCAILFSIIQTNKENGLDPYRYLTWVLKTAPHLNMNETASSYSLLPINAPEERCSGIIPL